jgi:hypothetical protein
VRRGTHVHDDHDGHSHHHRGLVGDNGATIDSCGTPDVTPEQRAEMNAAMMKWETNRGPPGARQTRSYVIQTWIHVLAKDAKTGQLNSNEIDSIIVGLNKYFTGSAFSFELAGSQTIENESWHECSYANEVEYKPATRRGGRDTLNIWVRRVQVQVLKESSPTHMLLLFLDLRCHRRSRYRWLCVLPLGWNISGPRWCWYVAVRAGCP